MHLHKEEEEELLVKLYYLPKFPSHMFFLQLLFCHFIIHSPEKVSIWGKKYLGNIRHSPDFIPSKSDTTHMKDWTNQK